MDMMRREIYLGCRVSSESEVFRGSPNRFRTIDGVGVSHHNNTGNPDYSSTTAYAVSHTFHSNVTDIYKFAQEILLSKHSDYGATNIANAPGGALNGLRVRIHDKTARINNLIDSGKSAQHESLRDSFLDLMNYAAIALLVIDGNWPSE